MIARQLFLTAFLLVVFGSACLGSDSFGYVEVRCEPGADVYLDGVLRGVTSSSLGGLILRNVSPGTHTLKVMKSGYTPQVESIDVAPGEVLVFTVHSLRAAVQITQDGEQGTGDLEVKPGSLLVQSLPVSCTIDVPGLGLIGSEKSKDRWQADNILAGSYTVSFTAVGVTLTGEVAVVGGLMTEVMVDFPERSVKVEIPSSEVCAAVMGSYSSMEEAQERLGEANAKGLRNPSILTSMSNPPVHYVIIDGCRGPQDEYDGFTAREQAEMTAWINARFVTGEVWVMGWDAVKQTVLWTAPYPRRLSDIGGTD